MIVKICGITRPGDSRECATEGADMIGLVFASSPRMVTVEAAERITGAVDDGLSVAGVFMDHTLDEVVRAARRLGLDRVQLHGSETPEFCAAVREATGAGVIKAIAVTGSGFVGEAARYAGDSVEYLLLDSPRQAGPAGKRAPLPLELIEEALELGKPFILAGGLTPWTVREAILRIRPAGVDVSSGVESAPGIKDRSKVRRFIREAREASEDLSG